MSAVRFWDGLWAEFSRTQVMNESVERPRSFPSPWSRSSIVEMAAGWQVSGDDMTQRVADLGRPGHYEQRPTLFMSSVLAQNPTTIGADTVDLPGAPKRLV